MLIRYPACELGDQCTCAHDADSGGMPEPGCLWFFWGKRDDGGLTEVLREALERQRAQPSPETTPAQEEQKP